MARSGHAARVAIAAAVAALVGATALLAGLSGRSAARSGAAHRLATSSLPAADPGRKPPACTRFAAPGGNGRGRRRNDPAGLVEAARAAGAGTVLCLEPGRYDLHRVLTLTVAGRPSAWVVIRAERGLGSVVIVDRVDVPVDMLQVGAPGRYVEFDDLVIDGAGRANAGIKCNQGASHVRAYHNRIVDVFGGGISSVGCDYVDVERNVVFRGQGNGASSGISINQNTGAVWADRRLGFHSIVDANVVAGIADESSFNTDGNGIIIDRGGDTAPVLIANNLVYMNGGRCIEAFKVARVWAIANTCYANELDLGAVGELSLIESRDVHVFDNLLVAPEDGVPWRSFGSSSKHGANATYGPLRGPRGLFRASPLLEPPLVPRHGFGRWRGAPDPAGMAGRLGIDPGVPLAAAGVDPAGLPGLDSVMRAQVRQHLGRDLLGESRVGSRFRIGALAP